MFAFFVKPVVLSVIRHNLFKKTPNAWKVENKNLEHCKLSSSFLNFICRDILTLILFFENIDVGSCNKKKSVQVHN
jgi:hypothetical protein